MIQVNELRIGNWINNVDGESVSVNELREDFYIVKGIGGQFYSTSSGIPLTPDILEKCGFEKMPLSSVSRYRDTATLFFLQTRNNKDWFVYGYKYYPAPIQSIHQLQNLYFSLTGEELKVKI